jgi:hypothetical protein
MIHELVSWIMIRALLARLFDRLRSSDAGSRSGDSVTDEDAVEDESGFVPSQLDASVLFAHGKGDETDRAIADVEEQARTLERRNR